MIHQRRYSLWGRDSVRRPSSCVRLSFKQPFDQGIAESSESSLSFSPRPACTPTVSVKDSVEFCQMRGTYEGGIGARHGFQHEVKGYNVHKAGLGIERHLTFLGWQSVSEICKSPFLGSLCLNPKLDQGRARLQPAEFNDGAPRRSLDDESLEGFSSAPSKF